ncbi:hypothetical protein GALL_158400 [mine drainage metagenome]|uniref:Uncharacterized protein n=1 Tax=mine drainage metagenome TaxID=410659 RepID=A0A1J5SPI8_9ZZZZ
MKNVLATYAFKPRDWYDLGRSLQTDHPFLAGLCFKAAVEHDRAFLDAWYELACCQERLGLTEAAVKTVRVLTEAAPYYGAARGMLIRLLLRQGKDVEARRVAWDGGKVFHRRQWM